MAACEAVVFVPTAHYILTRNKRGVRPHLHPDFWLPVFGIRVGPGPTLDSSGVDL
jgi:hypothetical protein